MVDASNCSEDDKIPFPKKKTRFFKDELGGKIMKEFVALRPKTHSYLMGDDNEYKKAKGTKKCVKKEYLRLMIIKIAY